MIGYTWRNLFFFPYKKRIQKAYCLHSLKCPPLTTANPTTPFNQLSSSSPSPPPTPPLPRPLFPLFLHPSPSCPPPPPKHTLCTSPAHFRITGGLAYFSLIFFQWGGMGRSRRRDGLKGGVRITFYLVLREGCGNERMGTE